MKWSKKERRRRSYRRLDLDGRTGISGRMVMLAGEGRWRGSRRGQVAPGDLCCLDLDGDGSKHRRVHEAEDVGDGGGEEGNLIWMMGEEGTSQESSEGKIRSRR